MRGSDIQRILDRQEIEDLVGRYARALDAHDAEQIRALYPPSFIADYEPISGIPAREVPSDAFARMIAAGLGPLKTQHLIASPIIAVDGDSARGSFYCLVHHWRDEASPSDPYVQWGGYDVEFKRLDGAWKIVRQRQYLTHAIGDSTMLGLENPEVQALMREVFGLG